MRAACCALLKSEVIEGAQQLQNYLQPKAQGQLLSFDRATIRKVLRPDVKAPVTEL
jgi:hypothetical protein